MHSLHRRLICNLLLLATAFLSPLHAHGELDEQIAILTARIESGFQKQAFLQFNVTGIPTGATVLGTNLLLTSQTTGTGRSITARAVSNTSWSETGNTWSNKPALGASLATVSSHTAGVDSSWNLGTHIAGNGNVTIGFDSTYSGDTNFHSREATDANNRPELVITYQP